MLFATLLDQSQNKIFRGRTMYYNCESILKSLSATSDSMLSISDSMLLTPFYLTEKTYEIYQYGFNLYLLSDAEYESKASDRKSLFECTSKQGKVVRISDAIYVKKSHPYFKTEDIELYIRFLFECTELKEEAKRVFRAPFERDKLYFEVC